MPWGGLSMAWVVRETAVAPLHQPIEAESDFGSGSSQTRTIFVLSDARKSFATSRQMSA